MTVSVLDQRYLALTALVTIAYQGFFFLVTYALKFDKVTDFAGSTNFALVALLSFVLGGHYGARQIVLSACVFVWAARLAAFLLYRIILWGEDRRFDDQRENVGKLVIFWSLQAIWVWTVSLPTTIVNANAYNPALNALDYVGWVIFALGLALETVADQQKLLFKQSEASKGRWADVGVWSYSRHPNYAGELMVWYGLYISSLSVLRGAEHAAVAGPIFITLLLLFVSGIPINEQSADEKHGMKDEYRLYKQRTSVLVPFPPALYSKLPDVLKKTVMLDFPTYNRALPSAKQEPNENSTLVERNEAL